MHLNFFLCISCCLGILRNPLGSHSRNLAFVFQKCQHYCSSNRNKKETASLPGRVSCVAPAGILTFLTPTCLPPRLVKKHAVLAEPEPNIKHGFNVFMPFLPGSVFLGTVWFTENMCTFSLDTQNILLFDDIRSLFTFHWVKGGEKRNSRRKVIVRLCHMLSC
uniref:Secreted protein n=1 Tax=Myotis myotis TaxID=51298 RepID=A0A7J7ZZ29_MYOMY|nr:hypothetical protein mMyoMyo1_009965 [Myotis myotis]